MGGEEFLVICPDTGIAAAMHLAERLRAAMARTRFASGSISHVTTVSVGAAQREPDMVRMDELIKAADNALLAAKSTGRNRVMASPVLDLPGRTRVG
jgi:diguanylate cyclase (GGDEF)-like protein